MTNEIETKKEDAPIKPKKKERDSLSGSKSTAFTQIIGNQVLNAMWLAHSNDETKERQVEATIAVLNGIAPQDEIEGMLAGQMIAIHNASMECFRRAMISEQTFAGRDNNLKHAAKLTRCYTDLMNGLQKYRGKGQQKMTVEHVHVNEGGQAIIGNVAK